MRDQERPGAGQPWRSRPQRRPRQVHLKIRRQTGIVATWVDDVLIRPGRLIAVIEDDPRA